MQLREKIDAAEGVRKSDLVLTGGQLVNVATGEIYPADVAVAGDLIAAVGDVAPHTGPDTAVIDVSGRYLVPGLIDGHLHIECSKLSITMFADAVVRYGTTSVVSGLDQTFAVAGLDGVRDALVEAAAEDAHEPPRSIDLRCSSPGGSHSPVTPAIRSRRRSRCPASRGRTS